MLAGRQSTSASSSLHRGEKRGCKLHTRHMRTAFIASSTALHLLVFLACYSSDRCVHSHVGQDPEVLRDAVCKIPRLRECRCSCLRLDTNATDERDQQVYESCSSPPRRVFSSVVLSSTGSRWKRTAASVALAQGSSRPVQAWRPREVRSLKLFSKSAGLWESKTPRSFTEPHIPHNGAPTCWTEAEGRRGA